MSRKTKRFKRKLLVPFEWFGIGASFRGFRAAGSSAFAIFCPQ